MNRVVRFVLRIIGAVLLITGGTLLIREAVNPLDYKEASTARSFGSAFLHAGMSEVSVGFHVSYTVIFVLLVGAGLCVVSFIPIGGKPKSPHDT